MDSDANQGVLGRGLSFVNDDLGVSISLDKKFARDMYLEVLRPEFTNQTTDEEKTALYKLDKAISASNPQRNGVTSFAQSASSLNIVSLIKLRSYASLDCMLFRCSDSKEVFAHPCILAAHSLLFERYFSGPWTDLKKSRCWNAEYSSELMNSILDFVYVGHVNQRVFVTQCADLYIAASEYQFEALKNVARISLSVTLTDSNVKDTLCLAHLHGDRLLILECYRFIGANAHAVLLNPSFAALSSDNPTLWQEMYKYILPDKEYPEYSPTK
jgi:BTB/POZ domain